MGRIGWESRTLRHVGALVALVVVASAAAYTVVPGDTLSRIAQRHGVALGALVEANGISNPDLIRVGQVLTIPGAAPPQNQSAPPPPDQGGRTHVVQPGESLSRIAARYGVTVDDLVTANGISDPNRVLAGSRLRLDPSVPADVPAGVAPTVPGVAGGGGTHVVSAGQTLSGIAATYGVSTADLAAANGLADPNLIRVGQRLVVPGGWLCPVPDVTRFVDDFGAPRAQGRFHEGTDLFAPRGSPVVAPVGGTVEVLEGSIGGKQFRLRGDDGFLYIGTHLDAFGATGAVAAGTVIGHVGDSGSARGTSPHLHFEIHPRDLPAINPYPTLQVACR